MKFFSVKEFSFIDFDFKNGCKNEFKDNNENHEADSIGFLTKSIWKPWDSTKAMPTAGEFNYIGKKF